MDFFVLTAGAEALEVLSSCFWDRISSSSFSVERRSLRLAKADVLLIVRGHASVSWLDGFHIWPQCPFLSSRTGLKNGADICICTLSCQIVDVLHDCVMQVQYCGRITIALQGL